MKFASKWKIILQENVFENVIPDERVKHTDRCRYNVVQYNAIIHTALQLLMHYINPNMHSQKIPYTSP